MPDWSYRTLLQPLLFALPPRAARDLALGVMGTLGRSRVGSTVIDLLGHMRAPAALERRHLGLTFPSAVGLGAGLDPYARATHALARFGVGFVEIGPVTLEPTAAAGALSRSGARQSIVTSEPPESAGVAAVAATLAGRRPPVVPVFARLAVTTPARATDECLALIESLAPYVSAFSVPAGGPSPGDAAAHFKRVVDAVRQKPQPRAVLACVPTTLDADPLAEAAITAGVDGLLVDGAQRPGPQHREIGAPSREPTIETVARLRARFPTTVIVAAGGVHAPEDALRLTEAGADLVTIESGLVFSGPGLPKRANEALLYAADETGDAHAREAKVPPTERSWFWSLLMGVGMLLGSVLALVISATRVVLPYDEQFVSMTRDELAAVNDRLLDFMAHDRVTLAGTMITIGLLYTALSWFGIRRGRHWARVAVLASSFVGFGTFFLFLGFGYFDPFHAFVTAILFQFFLLGLHCGMAEPHHLTPPVLRDDWRWRLAQWGQLGLIAEAVGFLVAGLVICTVGVTQVFVAEDLEFMRTTREALVAAGPRLIPLVAHDRATFGGMLLVSGLTFLMTSLWGFARGSRWLFWTLLFSGLAGYTPTLAIHYTVGYHSPFHLAPAWAGLVLFLVAMGCSYPYLCGRDAALEKSWNDRRARG